MKPTSYLLLSRLARHKLLEQRTGYLEVAEKFTQTVNQIKILDDSLMEEHAFVSVRPDLKPLLEEFRKNLSQKQVQLARQKRAITQEMQSYQRRINHLFREKKSYEIPYRTMQQTAEESFKLKEQKTLDEVALLPFIAKFK